MELVPQPLSFTAMVSIRPAERTMAGLLPVLPADGGYGLQLLTAPSSCMFGTSVNRINMAPDLREHRESGAKGIRTSVQVTVPARAPQSGQIRTGCTLPLYWPALRVKLPMSA